MRLPPDDLIIRAFTPADQAGARALILAGLGEHFGAIDETLNPDLDDIAASYPAATGNIFLAAEHDGALVGTAALTTEDPDDPNGWIVRVSVDPAQRRRGLATALVAHLIALAEDRRMELLLVETNKDWTAAIALYAQCGFSTYDEDAVSVYMSLDLQQRHRDLHAYTPPAPLLGAGMLHDEEYRTTWKHSGSPGRSGCKRWRKTG